MTSTHDSSTEFTEWTNRLLGSASPAKAHPDIAQFGKALALAGKALASRPSEVTGAGVRCLSGMSHIPSTALSRWLGRDVPAPFGTSAADRRFSDPAWSTNPAFYGLQQAYLALAALVDELISNAGLPAMTARKAHLAAGLILDLVAPTNFLMTNPAALQKAFRTGGASALRGARNFADDVVHNNGRPRQVDATGFHLGQNLAATPCQVVFRNDLIELLQYTPQTEQVRAAPLLCSPPWINKYYIMDLAPQRSFIEWAVQHHRTVFAISYRNPGPESAGLTMDDYLSCGPEAALDVITDITGAATVDVAGLCLGGAMTAVLAAVLTQRGDQRIGNLTLLNTMLDYSDPGALGMFTEPATVDALESKMQAEGTLSGAAMAETFDVLRANDLIFNYVASNWLMGEDPPAFDILAWNADSTRMPATMHASYLRDFYVENRLARDTLRLGGEQIRLGSVAQDCYVVGAENDHIVPWTSAYATTQLVSGEVRFVLSSGGHVAGIVNPPGPKGWYLTSDQNSPTAAEWREQAERHTGSWWEDWARWSASNSGDMTVPPRMGSVHFPALGVGPGDYVRG